MENLDPTETTQSNPTQPVGILTQPIAAPHPSPPLLVGLDEPPPGYPPFPQDPNA